MTFQRKQRVLSLLCLALGLALLGAAIAFGAPSTVAQVATSPDGQWRVEVADFARHQVFELWATPAVGGVRRKIGHTVRPLEDVGSNVRISADSRRVVYTQGETASGNGWLLYSTPIASQGGQRISQTMTSGGAVDRFELTWDGLHVRYRADVVVDEQFAWYRVAVIGGPIVAEGPIFADGFEGGNTGAWR